MPTCIVPGCRAEAVNNLSIRLRRPNTSAIWAPNLEAFVCSEHATAGARIEIYFEPTKTGHIETRVHGVNPDDPHRMTEIRHEARLADDLRNAAARKGTRV